MARAKFGYQLVSEDKTQEGIKSAQGGLKNLEGSMKSVNKVAATLMGAGAIAGVTMALRKLYQGASEAEKAFAAMYPETQKAAGSLGDWNRAMTGLKAQAGGVVAGVMTPIRAAFLAIIDPIGMATRELAKLNEELGKISERYTSSGTKQFENMKAAQEALANAARVNKDSQSELNEVLRQQAMLAKQKPSTTIPSTLPVGMDPMQWLAIQENKLAQWQDSMAILDSRAKKLAEAVSQTAYQVREIPKWIKENTKGGAAAPAQALNFMDWSGFGGYGFGMTASPFGDMADWAEQSAEAFGTKLAPVISDAMIDLTNAGLGMGSGTGAGWGATTGGGVGLAELGVSAGGEIDPLMMALSMLGEQFTSIAALMDPWKIILQSMVETLTPVIDSVLGPLIGQLMILGRAAGQILTPAIQALAPIVDVLGKIFVWMYNNVVVPVGNGVWALFTNIGNTIKWLVEKIVALGTTIWYIVSLQWGKLGSVGWGTAVPVQANAMNGPLTAISQGDLSAAGASYQSSYGSSASYTQARPITVNVVVNTDVITGETGGFRELAIKMQNEIEAVLALGLA